MACCLRRATCAAITLCLSTTSRQFAHWQSRQRHRRLWPLRRDTTPWFLQRAHFGLRLSLRGAGASSVLISSRPSMSSAHSALRESKRVTSTCESLSAVVDIYKQFSWTDAANHMQSWYVPMRKQRKALVETTGKSFEMISHSAVLVNLAVYWKASLTWLASGYEATVGMKLWLTS